MDKIESFNATRNLQRVASGFKGGPFNKLSPVPQKAIINGWPSETEEKLDARTIKQGTPLDPWNMRRVNGA